MCSLLAETNDGSLGVREETEHVAVRDIISAERGDGHAYGIVEDPPPDEGEVSGRSDGRSPPAQSDDGF